MKYGISLAFSSYEWQPTDLAQQAEERGFESIWFPEHTHVPLALAAHAALRPEHYFLDPFVACAVAAAVTSEIRVGTSVCLVNQRDPIITAKAVATLDRISGGRFHFGVGAGWNTAEIANHGVNFKTRYSLMRERLLAMKQIWTRDIAEVHGRFVNFEGVTALPKPLQTPHPPILLGGDGPKTLEHVAEYADGWMPWLRVRGVPHRLGARIRTLRDQVETAGRDWQEVEVTLLTASTDTEDLFAFEAMGIHRLVFVLPDVGPADMVARIDDYARLARP